MGHTFAFGGAFSVTLLCFCSIQVLCFRQTYDYDVIADDKTFLATCQGEDNQGNMPLSDIIDISSLTFTFGDDLETLYTNGDVVVKLDVPKTPILLQMDVQRWEGGQWAPTLFSLRREDFCQAMNDPREFWYPMVIQIPKKQRTCPPSVGHIYSMRNMTNRLLLKNLPHVDIEGDLKVVMHFSVASHKTCLVVYVKVYRH